MLGRRIKISLILILFLVAAISWAIFHYTEGRPTERQAGKVFLELYPKVELIGVNITEDEVVARSFQFTFHKAGIASRVRSRSSSCRPRRGTGHQTRRLQKNFPETGNKANERPLVAQISCFFQDITLNPIL